MSNTDPVRPMDCMKPRWKGEKIVMETEDPRGLCRRDKRGNVLMLVPNVLSPPEVDDYIAAASAVHREQGPGGYGKPTPRYETFYTPDGSPYVYSGAAHRAKTYPLHVLLAIERIREVIDSLGHHCLPEFGELDISGDIRYDASLKQGGSVSPHADDEKTWPIIIIYSLGQTRYLRVREKNTGPFINVKMTHNSIVVMAGPSFQKYYTHQVDKLKPTEKVGVRLSLNIRYLPAEQRATKRQRSD